MEYKDWLLAQLEEIKATPTDLSRAIEGDELNQPTIQRILRGTTRNPRIGTAALIEKALRILGSKNPKYGHDDFIDGASRRIEEPAALPYMVSVLKPQTERDTWMKELSELSSQLDTLRLGMLIKTARDLVAEQPAKQTPKSSQ